MIEIVTTDDIKHLFSEIEKINERTKQHTIDIKMLKKELKEVRK